MSVTAGAAAQMPAKKSVALPKPCPASWLSLALDGENGTFNGMSHSGTLLVLRNLGPRACTVPALPTLCFEDAQHHPLDVARQVPVGMHPGPVMLPVVVPPGAELTAKLRWVDGDVFGNGGGSSASPAYLQVLLHGPDRGQADHNDAHNLSTAFHGTMFGPKGKPKYTQTPLRRDPVWCGDKR
uniref:DUF4232 domain-containing protein n=1 Tax=Acidobacterium capsulatum TaxID=33075 RepID=A0A7V4XT75_9BACT